MKRNNSGLVVWLKWLECLSNKSKALGSNPDTKKKKRQKEKEKKIKEINSTL
jgi:hypothetical protein